MARPISFDPEVALERAVDLFWSRGYQGVSIDDIVRSTGLNRHSLYGRYGSKYGLLQAALRRYLDDALRLLEETLEAPGSPRDRIERFLALRDPSCTHPFWSTMLERGCFGLRMTIEMRDAHPEIGAIAAGFLRRLAEILAPILREGQHEGQFRRDRDASELVEVMLGAYLLPMLLPPSPARTSAFLSVVS